MILVCSSFSYLYVIVGLANPKTVSVQPGGKDSVVLATTKTRKQNKPASLLHKSVMKKDFRRMAKAVENQVYIYMAWGYYFVDKSLLIMFFTRCDHYILPLESVKEQVFTSALESLIWNGLYVH